jgi:hypothetical protein
MSLAAAESRGYILHVKVGTCTALEWVLLLGTWHAVCNRKGGCSASITDNSLLRQQQTPCGATGRPAQQALLACQPANSVLGLAATRDSLNISQITHHTLLQLPLPLQLPLSCCLSCCLSSASPAAPVFSLGLRTRQRLTFTCCWSPPALVPPGLRTSSQSSRPSTLRELTWSTRAWVGQCLTFAWTPWHHAAP